MKHTAKQILTLLSLTVLLFAGLAHGQYIEKVIKADIPFEFSVGHQTFPAGKYSFVRQGPFLAVRDSRGYVLTTVVTGTVQALAAPTATKLKFSTEGGRHVLTQVWQQDSLTGQVLYPRKPSTNVAKRQTAPVQAAAGSRP